MFNIDEYRYLYSFKFLIIENEISKINFLK